jgi:hypothetical protein
LQRKINDLAEFADIETGRRLPAASLAGAWHRRAIVL